MRRRIYRTVEVYDDCNWISKCYDIIMILAIIISIIPLTVKHQSSITSNIDKVTVWIFILDYILRLITADYKLKQGPISFVKYPFTFLAVIDLLSILPSITLLHSGFKLFKIFRLLRTMRVLRVFKAIRYSKNIMLIAKVMQKQKDSLLVVLWLALTYIIISALVVFNVEPKTFPTFFDAIYWATVSLTTVGYGDIYPVSTAGRVVTMLSALMGVAIVALPASIITAGYMEEIQKNQVDREE